MPDEPQQLMLGHAGERPWHGLGVAVPHEVTSRDAITLAVLDWTVATQPVFTQT